MGDDVAASLDLRNYELLWPASLFASDGGRILRSSNSSWEDRAKWLMAEALADTTAVAGFEDLPNHSVPTGDPWASTATRWGNRAGTDQREWFTELVSRAAEIRHAAVPRPYWPQRCGSGLSHDGSTPRDIRRDFARIIGEFVDNRYLVEVFGEECVDDSNDLPDASEVIDRRLGVLGSTRPPSTAGPSAPTASTASTSPSATPSARPDRRR
ncbi:hypothetical protein OG975_01365 [Streptomyces sp. NBC_00203]